jgi:DNA-binding beta-propeller fold protein YncE
MVELRDLLKDALGDSRPSIDALDHTKKRVRRRERSRRLAAGTLAIVIAVAAGVYAWPALRTGRAPGPASTPTVPAVIEAHVAATIPVGRYPEDVAVGEGGVWVSVPAQASIDPSASSLVVRIDIETDQVVAEIPVPGPIAELVTGAGAVWGSIYDKSAFSIVRIDPATNRVVATIPDVGGPLAFGEGALWGSALDGNAASLVRIDPSTNEIVARVPLDTRIWYAEAGGGAVWLLTMESLYGPANEDAPTGDIIKVDPATNVIADRIQMSVKGTLGAPLLADGALWVPMCCMDSSPFMLRVNPDTDQEIGEPILRSGGTPFAVDMGRLLLMGEGGTLYALNIQTLREEELITSDWPAGHTTTELDTTTHSVWIANAAPLKTVTRIDLTTGSTKPMAADSTAPPEGAIPETLTVPGFESCGPFPSSTCVAVFVNMDFYARLAGDSSVRYPDDLGLPECPPPSPDPGFPPGQEMPSGGLDSAPECAVHPRYAVTQLLMSLRSANSFKEMFGCGGMDDVCERKNLP